MGSTTYGTMNDPKGGVAKVTCRTFEAMGQIPMFHRTYFTASEVTTEGGIEMRLLLLLLLV